MVTCASRRKMRIVWALYVVHIPFKGTKYISTSKAANIVEAVAFAKSIGLPLVAHLTIHWSGTIVFDDHDGTRFAKVREGISKVLLRHGIPVAWVWCRECKAHTDIVHSHLLFHLPVEYRFGRKLDALRTILERLVARHGDGIWSEYAVKLTICCSRVVAPKCGGYFASKRNFARRKASFTESDAGPRRTSAKLHVI